MDPFLHIGVESLEVTLGESGVCLPDEAQDIVCELGQLEFGVAARN